MISIDEAVEQGRSDLAGQGDWLTSIQRLEVWANARDSQTNALDIKRRQAISPEAISERHPAGQTLDSTKIDVVHRIASDPGRLTRTWAKTAMNKIGEETYTELVGVVAIAAVLDTYTVAMGRGLLELPPSIEGAPEEFRPSDVGDVGAWVSQSLQKTRANVSRSLSLVPRTNEHWRGLVDALYSHGAEFYDVMWNRALNRAQVELVAARTTSLLECFY